MSGATTAITIGIAVASAALGAYSSIQQGKQAAAQDKYTAAVARNNQVIAEQNAADAQQRGKIAEDEQRRKTQVLIGQQRASLAAQGGDINSGSALDIQGDTAAAGELDALTIRNNAAREARQYQIQAGNFSADAGLQQSAAANATTDGWLGAGVSLLGSADRYANRWGLYKPPASKTTNPLAGSLSGGGPRGF